VGKVLRHVPLDLPGLHCSRQPPEKQRAADLRGPVKAQDPQFILIHHQSSFVRSPISDCGSRIEKIRNPNSEIRNKPKAAHERLESPDPDSPKPAPRTIGSRTTGVRDKPVSES